MYKYAYYTKKVIKILTFVVRMCILYINMPMKVF